MPLSRTVPTLAVVLGLGGFFALAAPSPAPAQAPGLESFARKPTTPLENWEVADYLIRAGQPEQAVPYLKAFLAANPDDDTLLAVRDKYGTGSVLRLIDDAATRPLAQTITSKLSEASRRAATRPERVQRFIAALKASTEERKYAIDRLREAGPYAVPPIIKALVEPSTDLTTRTALVTGLGKLEKGAGPPLIATLDSTDATLVSDAAKALGEIGDARALPDLLYLAALPDSAPGAAARPRVLKAIEQITGSTYETQPKSAVKVLSEEARRYHTHGYRFPGESVLIWAWDDASKTPVSKTVPRQEAETALGLRAARKALALAPADQGAQASFLALAIEADPASAKAGALAAGPAVLTQLVRTSIADGRSDLAVNAVELLGQVTSRDSLYSSGGPQPLVEALSAPDRRVQLAAAEAILNLDPRTVFPGSSRLVPVLSWFVRNQSRPRAVLIDGNVARGNQTAALLKEIGYDALVAPTGAKGFQWASDTADVELIVVDPHFVQGPWNLDDTLSNLKADARTAGLPVFVIGELALQSRLSSRLANFPGTRFIVTPANADVLKSELADGLKKRGVRALGAEERTALAKKASALLGKIANRPGNPFESDLAAAAPALTMALGDPNRAADVSPAMGDVPGADVQRGLAATFLDPSKPAPLRLSAAQQLAKHIRRFGPLLINDQEKRLLQALESEPDPALKDAVGAVIGALKPRPEAAGKRLQTIPGAE